MPSVQCVVIHSLGHVTSQGRKICVQSQDVVIKFGVPSKVISSMFRASVEAHQSRDWRRVSREKGGSRLLGSGERASESLDHSLARFMPLPIKPQSDVDFTLEKPCSVLVSPARLGFWRIAFQLGCCADKSRFARRQMV